MHYSGLLLFTYSLFFIFLVKDNLIFSAFSFYPQTRTLRVVFGVASYYAVGSWAPSRQKSVQLFQWNTPFRGQNCKGVWKSRDFQLISRYISETVQDGPVITLEY